MGEMTNDANYVCDSCGEEILSGEVTYWPLVEAAANWRTWIWIGSRVRLLFANAPNCWVRNRPES